MAASVPPAGVVALVPTPKTWTTVAGVIREIAEFADAESICALRAVSSTFYDALDDTVWRCLCHRSFLPAPFRSFELYYRAAVMRQPGESDSGGGEHHAAALRFGKLPRSVNRTGNIVRGTTAHTSQSFPVVVLQLHEHHHAVATAANGASASAAGGAALPTASVLLLDRAEQVNVGVCYNADGFDASKLWGAEHSLHVVPFALPGMPLTLALLPDADDATRLRFRAMYCYDEHAAREKYRPRAPGEAPDPYAPVGVFRHLVDELLPEQFPAARAAELRFAIGLAAYNASAASL